MDFCFWRNKILIRAVQSLQMNWDVNLDPFEKGIKKYSIGGNKNDIFAFEKVKRRMEEDGREKEERKGKGRGN